MEATNGFLARIPRSSDGKRRWPLELKAAIVNGHKQRHIDKLLLLNFKS